MKQEYDDIRRRIATPPLWWDEHGVPRYDPPAPALVANIYAKEIAFYEIACQMCYQRFLVAASGQFTGPTLAERVASRRLHYGDPPNVWCCDAGPSLSSLAVRVVAFWQRDDTPGATTKWRRVPELEITLADYHDVPHDGGRAR